MPHHSPVIHQHTVEIHRRDGGIAFESFCQGRAPGVSNVIPCRTRWGHGWSLQTRPPPAIVSQDTRPHEVTYTHTHTHTHKTRCCCPFVKPRPTVPQGTALCHCHVMRTQDRVWAQTAMIGRRLIRGTEAEAQQWACGCCVTPSAGARREALRLWYGTW